MYTEERKAKHLQLIERCREAGNRITGEDTFTEDDDRTYCQEAQSLVIFADILDPEQHLLTQEGTDFLETRILLSEDWIAERIDEDGEESDA